MIIENINLSRYTDLGHDIGQIVTNLDDDIAYIPIPKNGSNYMKQYFHQLCNWTDEYNYYEHKKQKYIVVLRDPLERWMTGVVEYFVRQKYTIEYFSTFLDFAVKEVVLDEHTFPQTVFLDSLETDKMHFLKLDTFFNIKLASFVKNTLSRSALEMMDVRDFSKNDSATNNIKIELNYILQNYLQKNISAIFSLKNFYKEDYNLIDNIKFYDITHNQFMYKLKYYGKN